MKGVFVVSVNWNSESIFEIMDILCNEKELSNTFEMNSNTKYQLNLEMRKLPFRSEDLNSWKGIPILIDENLKNNEIKMVKL